MALVLYGILPKLMNCHWAGGGRKRMLASLAARARQENLKRAGGLVDIGPSEKQSPAKRARLTSVLSPVAASPRSPSFRPHDISSPKKEPSSSLSSLSYSSSVISPKSSLAQKSKRRDDDEPQGPQIAKKRLGSDDSRPAPKYQAFTNDTSDMADLDRMIDVYRQMWKDENARNEIGDPTSELAGQGTLASSIRCEGDRIYDAIVYDLNHIPPGDPKVKRLSTNQMKFCMAFLNACIPMIYGDDFDRFHDRIMKEKQLDSIDYEVFIQTPRRFGKTKAVAIFVACFLRHVKGRQIAVFSTGARVSGYMMREIKWAYNLLAGGDQSRIAKSTVEELAICPAGMMKGRSQHSKEGKMAAENADTSLVRCLPASPVRKFASHARARRERLREWVSVCCLFWCVCANVCLASVASPCPPMQGLSHAMNLELGGLDTLYQDTYSESNRALAINMT